MDGYATLIGVLLALLAGLAIGKAWERYKLQDGRWIDRRRGRESPHYLLGLNFLVANQVDAAIEELTHAAEVGGDSLEIRLLLGNLYREKGQVGRAIQEHQALLQRSNLRKLEHANVLLCLGLDYRRGGFVDRALEAFAEVVRLDPGNRYALSNLEKLYEEQHQWEEAYAAQQKLARSDAPGGADTHDRHQSILAFLENELGSQALKRGESETAGRRFAAAIELDPANPPAHLNLGDVRLQQGDMAGAVAAWEQIVDRAPDRAYLALPRLQTAYAVLRDEGRYADLCRRLISANPQDWRVRLALARYQSGAGNLRESLDLLFQALVHNPHALALHQAIWQILSQLQLPPGLVLEYIDLTRDAIFYLDPHICVRCRYRSTELLWQCPHCHEWNTFVEERIAPAKDTEATLTS
jgi:lipopolysaccharide assembly protein B